MTTMRDPNSSTQDAAGAMEKSSSSLFSLCGKLARRAAFWATVYLIGYCK